MVKGKGISYFFGLAPSQYWNDNCSSCGKPISKGRFRYHTENGKIIIFHQACCADWKLWKTIEKNDKRLEKTWKEKLSAIKKFQKKWKTTKKLDDEIYVLERLLKD